MVQGLDPEQVSLHHLDRGNVPPPDAPRKIVNAEIAQIVVAHRSSSAYRSRCMLDCSRPPPLRDLSAAGGRLMMDRRASLVQWACTGRREGVGRGRGNLIRSTRGGQGGCVTPKRGTG